MESPIMGIGKMASSLGSVLSALPIAANMSDSSGTMQKMKKNFNWIDNSHFKGELTDGKIFF
jgi:hypothetical protein